MLIPIAEILERAKAAPKPTQDVDVIFNSNTADKIEHVEKAIRDLAGDQRLADGREAKLREELAALQVEAAESMVTFRFTALEGWEWHELTAQSSPRHGNPVDQMRGYDFDQVCRIAAVRAGARVDGDEPVALTSEEWDQVWQAAPGPALEQINIAVWTVNEFEWQLRQEDAKKGRTASTGATSN